VISPVIVIIHYPLEKIGDCPMQYYNTVCTTAITLPNLSLKNKKWRRVPFCVIGSVLFEKKKKRLCEKSARRALRLRYVGASSSRVRLATPAGPSQRITRLSLLPSSSPPSPPSLALFSPRRVSVPPPPTRPSRCRRSPWPRSRGSVGSPAPVNWSPAPSFASQQTCPLTLAGTPVDLCPRRLAAATRAPPRRFPSPLRLAVTSPPALLKPRAAAAATSSRDMLTSRLPAISGCRAFFCRTSYVPPRRAGTPRAHVGSFRSLGNDVHLTLWMGSATGDLSGDPARRWKLQNVPVPGLARALAAVCAADLPLRHRRLLAPSRLHPQPCHLPLFPAVGGGIWPCAIRRDVSPVLATRSPPPTTSRLGRETCHSRFV